MRKDEIEVRMKEVRELLTGDAEVDVDALETEVRSLKEEMKEIEDKERRAKVAKDIETGKVEAREIEKPQEDYKMEERIGVETPEYRTAFLKQLQGKELTDAEKRFVLTPPGNAGSGAAAVPTETANRIFDNMIAIAPMLSEIELFRVAGNLRFAVQGNRAAAAVHVENVPVAAAADTLINVTLTGYEFMKVLSVSATVSSMSIDAFEGWIAKILGEDLALIIDNEIINGGSVTGDISTAQAWVNGVNQITYVPGDGLAYSDLTSLIGLLPSAFDGNAKFVMSKRTFYTQVLGMTNAGGDPIAVPDIASPGRYMILGYPVLIDDNVVLNEAFLGDFRQVVGNLGQDILVEGDKSSGFLRNAVDYRGTALFDCDVAQPTAIVKLNV